VVNEFVQRFQQHRGAEKSLCYTAPLPRAII
jgi:hypothetical protein